MYYHRISDGDTKPNVSDPNITIWSNNKIKIKNNRNDDDNG